MLTTFGMILIVILLAVIFLTPEETTRNKLLKPQPKKPMPKIPSTKEWKIGTKIEQIVYSDYLKSTAWKFNTAKVAALARDEFKCAMCDDDYKIEVHHIHYYNLGNESQDQLVTLCHACHRYTHKVAGKGAGFYPPVKKPKE